MKKKYAFDPFYNPGGIVTSLEEAMKLIYEDQCNFYQDYNKLHIYLLC